MKTIHFKNEALKHKLHNYNVINNNTNKLQTNKQAINQKSATIVVKAFYHSEKINDTNTK